MNKGQISTKNFYEDFQAMKYWSFPSSWDTKKRKMELNKILFSGEYLASVKMDGYWQRFIKDDEGNIFMCSRNKGVNGVVEKFDRVPHLEAFFEEIPNGTCLLAEIFLPGRTSRGVTTILGCNTDKAIQRQEKEENKLNIYIFDILAYDGKLLLGESISNRIKTLETLEKKHTSPYVIYAKYYTDPNEIYDLWVATLEKDGEGIVLTHKDYPYQENKRTARKTLKLKKELEETVDVFLTGRYKKPTREYQGKELESWQYWINEKTGERSLGDLSTRVSSDIFTPVTKAYFYSWAGSVEIAVVRDNKIFPIGWISNLTEEVKKGIVDDPKEWKGKVAELQAMEIERHTGEPTIRHGRIIRFRDDKNLEDCTYDQLM